MSTMRVCARRETAAAPGCVSAWRCVGRERGLGYCCLRERVWWILSIRDIFLQARYLLYLSVVVAVVEESFWAFRHGAYYCPRSNVIARSSSWEDIGIEDGYLAPLRMLALFSFSPSGPSPRRSPLSFYSSSSSSLPIKLPSLSPIHKTNTPHEYAAHSLYTVSCTYSNATGLPSFHSSAPAQPQAHLPPQKTPASQKGSSTARHSRAAEHGQLLAVAVGSRCNW